MCDDSLPSLLRPSSLGSSQGPNRGPQVSIGFLSRLQCPCHRKGLHLVGQEGAKIRQIPLRLYWQKRENNHHCEAQ